MIRILFVDDEELLLQGCARRLRQMKRPERVEVALGGAKALTMLQQASAEGQGFDAVVSDLRMPGMDGAALLEAVYHGWPDAVRVLLSGQTDLLARSNVRYAQLRFNKPAALEEILQAVQYPIGFARTLTPQARREAQALSCEYSIERLVSELGLPSEAQLLNLEWPVTRAEQSPGVDLRDERRAALIACGSAARNIDLETAQGLAFCIAISLLKPGFSTGFVRALDAVTAEDHASDARRVAVFLRTLTADWFGGQAGNTALYLLSLWGVPATVLETASEAERQPAVA